jgi:hypothetical protein
MYQRRAKLWWWSGRCIGYRLRLFHLVRANGEPRLLAEKVAKRGEHFWG